MRTLLELSLVLIITSTLSVCGMAISGEVDRLLARDSLSISGVEYKESLISIFRRNARGINWLVNSADGSKLAFVTDQELGGYSGLYVMDADGGNLEDYTPLLPAGVEERDRRVTVGSIRDLQMNESGSRLFFRAYPSQETVNYVLIMDTNAKELFPGFVKMVDYDWRDGKSFSINSKGNRVYYRHNDGQNKPWSRGFFKAVVDGGLFGNAPGVRYLGIDQLPGNSPIGFLLFLGHGGDTTLFAWQDDTLQSDTNSMWIINDTGLSPGPALNFTPQRVSANYRWVWPLPSPILNDIVSADGRLALGNLFNWEQPSRLYLIDLTLESPPKLLAEAGLSGFLYPHVSPSGRYARFRAAGYNDTRVDLLTDERRDTQSELILQGILPAVTNITKDDRYYFMGTVVLDETGLNVVRIHKVDMAPTDFDIAPDITEIDSSNTALSSDGTMTMTVTATVSDTQGNDTIEWVKMASLVDGLESENNTPPLAFSPEFYDDGSNGDSSARDGVYTNTSVVAFIDFFEGATGPRKVSVRVVAKDQDDNYTVADKALTVTEN